MWSDVMDKFITVFMIWSRARAPSKPIRFCHVNIYSANLKMHMMYPIDRHRSGLYCVLFLFTTPFPQVLIWKSVIEWRESYGNQFPNVPNVVVSFIYFISFYFWISNCPVHTMANGPQNFPLINKAIWTWVIALHAVNTLTFPLQS